MMSQHCIDDTLKQIIEQADDVSKAVLAVYKHDKHHDINKEALAKQTVEYLETCAAYLKIKLVDNTSKKLFSNKAALADQIILVIESYFPATCQDCEEEYTIQFGGPEPKLRCMLCLQGSHDCEERLAIIKQIEELPGKCFTGLGWLCHSCFQKNNALQTPQFDSHAEEPQITPPPTDKVTKDCEDYRHGKCIHGASGKKEVDGQACKFLHRKKCVKWCKHGKSRYGCQKGDECERFHPALCKFSLHQGLCRNKKCPYVHPIGTRMKDQHRFQQQFPGSPRFHSHNPPRNNNFYKNKDSRLDRNTNESFGGDQYYDYSQNNDMHHVSEAPQDSNAIPSDKGNQRSDFLSIVETLKSMEEKFANQIASLQSAVSSMTTQSTHFQNNHSNQNPIPPVQSNFNQQVNQSQNFPANADYHLGHQNQMRFTPPLVQTQYH